MTRKNRKRELLLVKPTGNRYTSEVMTETAQAQEPDDRDLVRRSRAGDLDAYDTLVRRYQGRIYGLVYHMTSNKEDAEDLVQDVFLTAFRNLHRFKERAAFYTWIYRIGVNRTLNFLKKRKRRQAVSLNDTDAGVERDEAYKLLASRETPFRGVSLSELGAKLNKALQTLSEKHRAVVVLHDVQGLSGDTVANMLGCSQGTVRSRLFYARRQLQNELAEWCS